MPEPLITADNSHRIAEMLKALGHPLRLRIVALLCLNDERVGDLAKVLELRPALVSQQLRILRMTGLVEVVREDGVGRYTLAEPRLVSMVECMAGCRR